MINSSLLIESIPALLEGLLMTLLIAGLGSIFGVIGGTALGILEGIRNTFLQIVIGIYTNIIRGTPMLIQILFIFYVLPQLGTHVSAFWAAVIAIGLNSSAYISQVIRSGINAVSSGQREAALVLGLNPAQTMWYIILPQAVRTVLPALGNEFITLIKDSSLASVIGVVELTKAGDYIISRTYDALTIYTLVALFYLAITVPLSLIMRTLEQRSAHAQN